MVMGFVCFGGFVWFRSFQQFLLFSADFSFSAFARFILAGYVSLFWVCVHAMFKCVEL